MRGRLVPTRCRVRHFIPRPLVELAASGLREPSSPLLEEERHLCCHALIANISHPRRRYRSPRWTALASDNHPIDAVEGQMRNRPEQRLDGQEPHGCGHLPKVVDAIRI